MSTPPGSSRRRTFDFPKSSPDAGLAEWTSRIKAIQQEVDRDEEAEQRRLQDEITKSRMDRARRRNTATGSIDWTAKRTMSPSNEVSDNNEPIVDRQVHQSDVLRQVAGSATPSSSPRNPSASTVTSPDSHGSRPDGVSLAAFMGGRATGPRLNKPVPQQNSHDPTLFDQTRREGPHPIFGKPSEAQMAAGRVKLPSMLRTPALETTKPEDIEGRVDSAHVDELEGAATTSQESINGVAGSSSETSSRPLVHHKPPNQNVRPPEVTTGVRPFAPPEVPTKPVIYRKPSTPTIPTSDLNADSGHSVQVRTPPKLPVKPTLSHSKSRDEVFSSKPLSPQPNSVPIQSKPTSLAEMIGGRASGPRLNKQDSRERVGDFTEASMSSHPALRTQGRALPGMGATTSPSPPQPWSTKLPSTSPARSSSQQGPNGDKTSNPDSSPKRSFSGSQVSTPSLARPVQPQVIVQPSPIAAASATVSPAFLRAPPSTQDLHPSLSRLQGRGFVEKRVKASTDIYGGSDTHQPERTTSAGAGRRPTVLDRWQPTVASPASPPPSSPPSNQVTYKGKKAEAEEPLPASRLTSFQQVIRPRTTSPALGRVKSSTFEETRQEIPTPVRLPGMATSTSFLPKQRVQWPSPEVGRTTDESTIERSTSVSQTNLTQLTHPTRDRARKPRKSQGPHAVPRTQSPRPKTPELDGIPDNGRIDRGPRANTELQERMPSPETRQQPSTSAKSTISRLKEELAYPAPAVVVWASGAKPPNVAQDTAPFNQGKQVLPSSTAPSQSLPRPTTPTSPASVPEEGPLSPSRHSRIPSTGHRATVMDVAQALQQHEQHIRESSLTPEPDAAEPSEVDAEPEEIPRTDVKAAIAGWGRNVGSGVQQAERRRSGYDRHSIVTLPPLLEEKTPAPTPQGSLSRGFAQTEGSTSSVYEVALAQLPKQTHRSLHVRDASGDAAEGGTAKPSVENVEQTVAERPPVENVPGPSEDIVADVLTDSIPVPSVESVVAEPLESTVIPNTSGAEAEREVILEHHDKPPPGFNLHFLLKEVSYSPNPQTQTISVEVILISGHTATSVTREPNVFYDSDVYAVVHRAKEKINGLVSTDLWAWRGKDAKMGDMEVRKVAELAGRFGTKETLCLQGSEPNELIHVLGGVLAIRQGTRAHWTAENTAMHRVHRIGDSIFVDEIDLAIHNLCSAYSYCLSVLDALYVWHGRGSSEDERKVASAYGQSLTTEKMGVVEFEEGAEDEMFWMMLGDGGFANASHWKFRLQLDRAGARLYKIDCTRPKAAVQLIPIFSARDLPDDGVFVVDCRLELFVVITPPSRGKRRDIQLALFLAENISAAVSNQRPFDPPIHVVILPSKLPVELQAAIRLCDEAGLNGGSVPDHMNLLSLPEALEHMRRRSWPRSTLSDANFLPLGVDPSKL